MKLRLYQEQAKSALLSSRRGIIKIPAGGGKTIIMAAAIRELMDKFSYPYRILWLANTREQCEQAVNALDRFEIKGATVRCAAGGWKGEDPELLVVDECHHAGADEWADIISRARGIRWGMSATPHRNDDRARLVYELIGPIIFQLRHDTLTNDGHLARGMVIMHDVNTCISQREEEEDTKEMLQDIEVEAKRLFDFRMRKYPWLNKDETLQRCTWQAASRIGIVENLGRNMKIRSLANNCLEEGRSTLVLVGTIEHGERLSKGIEGSEVCSSKVGKRARASMIERTRSGQLRCLIATSLADEGMDIPCLSALIMAGGGRSAAKIEQRAGRVLRTFAGKSESVIHDFFDRQHYFLQAQSAARFRVYRSLGIQFEN